MAQGNKGVAYMLSDLYIIASAGKIQYVVNPLIVNTTLNYILQEQVHQRRRHHRC